MEQDEEPPNRRGALIALVAVVLLVLAGMYLTGVLRHTSGIQDCVMSGRTNCAPVRTGGG